MARPIVLIFHRPASGGDAPLVRLLADVRRRLADHQARLFERAGAGDVRLVEAAARSFGQALAQVAPRGGGIIALGSGAVARLTAADARRLVTTAAAGGRHALTNNRYSSDICAISDAAVLAHLPALPSDNALPRWLEERARFTVAEMPGRDRLALDLDSPLDVALAALAPGAPGWLKDVTAAANLTVPRRNELRRLAADPHAELLVFGRAGSTTLRWLERNVRCRVRFLSEERGLRASSPLAMAGPPPAGRHRPPRATIGRLLEQGGPDRLAEVVGELADGAIVDSRVLLADRLGADDGSWPTPNDRFASDLQRAAEVSDGWLRRLTESAAGSRLPILLGAHTLVGPGVPLLLASAARRAAPARRRPARADDVIE
ncbi:MAG: hypothetical protein M3N29_04620 [Chloroflexota bacterium]|nr:hypothetical protein [Chloroflexota bacterium]